MERHFEWIAVSLFAGLLCKRVLSARISHNLTDEPKNFQPKTKTRDTTESQLLLRILYCMAEDLSERPSILHRGVTCNGCGTVPIKGERFRCLECVDFDLCSYCEENAVWNTRKSKGHCDAHIMLRIVGVVPLMSGPRCNTMSWRPSASIRKFPHYEEIALPEKVATRIAHRQFLKPSIVNRWFLAYRCLADAGSVTEPKISISTLQQIISPMHPQSLLSNSLAMFFSVLFEFDGDEITFEQYCQTLSRLRNSSNESLLSLISAFIVNDSRKLLTSKETFKKIMKETARLSLDVLSVRHYQIGESILDKFNSSLSSSNRLMLMMNSGQADDLRDLEPKEIISLVDTMRDQQLGATDNEAQLEGAHVGILGRQKLNLFLQTWDRKVDKEADNLFGNSKQPKNFDDWTDIFAFGCAYCVREWVKFATVF